MPYTLNPLDKKFIVPSFWLLLEPLRAILRSITFLKSRGNRPLQMEFEDQLNALIYFHLEEHTSGRHLLQVLEEDDFARAEVASEAGIKKSSFFEAINSRGIEQMMEVFQALKANATKILPREFANLGDPFATDGSLLNAALSKYWADYRECSKKANSHI